LIEKEDFLEYVKVADEAVQRLKRIAGDPETKRIFLFEKIGLGHHIPLDYELIWDIDDQLIPASRLINKDTPRGTELLTTLNKALAEEALYQIISWRLKQDLKKKGN